MFPLKNWQKLKNGYRHGQPTWYSKQHIGNDYIVPSGTPIYAPKDGEIIYSAYGWEGGNTIWFQFDGLIMRVLHLRSRPLLGKVKMGGIIGYTGNTGYFTTGPHAHIDISRQKDDIKITKKFDTNFSLFINPDLYFAMTNTIILNEERSSAIYLALPVKTEAAFESYLENHGLPVYKTADNKIDWNKYHALTYGTIKRIITN